MQDLKVIMTKLQKDLSIDYKMDDVIQKHKDVNEAISSLEFEYYSKAIKGFGSTEEYSKDVTRDLERLRSDYEKLFKQNQEFDTPTMKALLSEYNNATHQAKTISDIKRDYKSNYSEAYYSMKIAVLEQELQDDYNFSKAEIDNIKGVGNDKQKQYENLEKKKAQMEREGDKFNDDINISTLYERYAY